MTLLDDRIKDILDPYVPDEDKVVVTNLIKASVLSSAPEPVNVHDKYELGELPGISVNMQGDELHDRKMLDFVLTYGQDCGYNEYFMDLTDTLKFENTVV